MNFGAAGGKKTKNVLIPIEFSIPQMITLAEDVSSWEIGDQIAIASTDFEQVILDSTNWFHFFISQKIFATINNFSSW